MTQWALNTAAQLLGGLIGLAIVFPREMWEIITLKDWRDSRTTK